MCGIAGFWSKKTKEEESRLVLRKMLHELNHRGPDYIGFWDDPSESIYFSHSRLSILDRPQCNNS